MEKDVLVNKNEKIPVEFIVNDIIYKVLSFEERTVEVGEQTEGSDTVIIPSPVTYNGIIFNVIGVGDRAFYSYYNVTSVILPNSIKYIGNNANSFNLIRIHLTLPSSLERVLESAYVFNKLDDLNLPSSLKEIGPNAFAFTKVGTEKAYIPASVVTIEGNPFLGSDLKEIIVDSGNSCVKSEDGVLFSKDGRKLIAYPDLKPEKTYTIPDGVTTIGRLSFGYNYILMKLIIPATVNKFENKALWSCSSIKTIVMQSTLPPEVGEESLHDIESNCFILVPKRCINRYKNAEGWKKFVNIVDELPTEFKINGINYNVLSFEEKTVEVGQNPQASGVYTIPSQVTYNEFTYNVVGVGDHAFGCNERVTSVKLPKGIKSIGICAFQTLNNHLLLPPSLEKIGRSAFTYTQIVDLRLPQNLQEIDSLAFAYTTIKTQKVNIPSSVTSIKGNPFYGSSIKEIKVSSGSRHFKSQDGVLFIRNGQKLLVYPTLKPDKTYAIPANVTTIGESSFAYNINLTNLIFPTTIKNLENNVFWSCPNLKTLVVKSTTPPEVEDMSLDGVESNCILIVPKGCVDKYKNADGWKKFKNIRSFPIHGFLPKEVYSDGIPDNKGPLEFSFPQKERKLWALSFDFKVNEKLNQWIFMLSKNSRIFGILLEQDGNIYITTNDQKNKYSLSSSYSLNIWHSVYLSFDNGLLTFQLNDNPPEQIHIKMNLKDEDNSWSCSNYSDGVKFKGYLRNIIY